MVGWPSRPGFNLADTFPRCRYHFYNIPHLTTLIASAMTLIVDLRLNRPEVYDGPDAFVIALREATARPWSKPPPRSLEERRAFLGKIIILPWLFLPLHLQ